MTTTPGPRGPFAPPALLTLLLAMALGPPAARAIVPHVPEGLTPAGAALLVEPPHVVQATSDRAWSAARAAADPGMAKLAADGTTWVARWDRRTDRPALAWGSGAPWMPGAGNDLTWSAVLPPGAKAPVAAHDVVAWLEARARRFLIDNPALLRVPDGVELRLDPRASGVLAGRVAYLTFRPHVRGVRVEGSSVVFRLGHGNLVQVGIAHVADGLGAVETTPAVTASAALGAARQRLSRALAREVQPAEILDPGQLLLLPWADDTRGDQGEPGRGLQYRLAWRVAFRVDGGRESWVSHVDARSGKPLSLFDANRYACPPPASPQGRVTGGVYLGAIEEVEESLRGMPFTAVTHGAPITTDFGGLYPYAPGQAAETALQGRYFRVTCDGCTSPPRAFVRNEGGGDLALGTGGLDEVGNGRSTRAERNCFYHLNVVRQLAAKHVADTDVNGYFSRTTPGTVNIADTCNAFFDGNGVNFYRSGGGCNNTGEIADVMQHEWGHGLDQFTGGGNDGARGEGLSDVVAFLSTHDPRLGPYFVAGQAEGIRNADELVAGLYSVANVDTVCNQVGQTGPLGYEVHCEGVIFSQAWWHLARNLRATHGEPGGWFAAEKLFFQHLPVSADGTYLPDQTSSAYDAVVLVDDDNGDLVDGTPNAADLNEAFLHHGVASTPQVADSGNCAPPVAPPVGLASAQNPATGLWQVRVTWPDVAGTVQYDVYRNDASGTQADLLVATVFPPAVDYLDDNVTDGATYHYRVATYDGAGCRSTRENQELVTVGAFAHFGLASFSVDDVGGNANGLAEPGESLAFPVTIANEGALDATTVSATIAPLSPGVTVTTPTVMLGDVAAGGQASSVGPHFGVVVDGTVACGSVLAFSVSIESTEGCSVSGFSLRLGELIGYQVLASDDFEADRGWTVNPDGTDDATAGIWERGDPNPTFFNRQPGDDHTPSPGTQCLVTGNAALDPTQMSSAGADDVDGGCTTAQSPLFNLGGQSGLEVAYWRYWIIATAFDDAFLAEVSNDGGFSWRVLERVTTPTGTFQEAAIPLDPILGGPANVLAFRFTACDRGAGSLLEALVDDLSIRRPIYSCEAPVARPRLQVATTLVGDSATAGGFGNGNGWADPGESVRIPVDLRNTGNGAAANVRGIVSIVTGPAAAILSDADAAWADIAPGATQRSGADAPAHFEVVLPRSGVPCDGRIELSMSVSYDGAAGSYTLDHAWSVEIGVDDDTPLYLDDFEGGDNGWTHGAIAGQDDWHHDAPAQDSPEDPPAAYSGTRVWGNDLGGFRAGRPWNGDYRPDTHNFLESAPIDGSGLSGATLAYRRWLSVEDGEYDHARVLVNGTLVWENPVGADLADASWVLMEHDISALADGNPSVVVRFELESDGGEQHGGWTLDDVRVVGRQRLCEGARGCETLPTPMTLVDELRATGVKGEDGAEFEWSRASRLPGEHFRLYRGTDATAVMDRLTPPDYTGVTHDDRTADGALYFYRVVLADCDGVEGE